MFLRLGKDYVTENKTCFDYWREEETSAAEFEKEGSPRPEELCLEDKEEKNLWRCIIEEQEKERSIYTEWRNKFKDSSSVVVPHYDGQSNYLNRKIFPLLLPAMEEMLVEARRWDALRVQKCRFNGLDYLAELLWNRNPRHPKRTQKWYNVFDIPQFKLLLHLHPRPIYPLSWLLTKDEAALHIQRYTRGWLVRKQDDVQEMRQFWKAISEENAEIARNLMDKDLGPKEKLRMEEQIDDLCEFYKLLGKYRK